MRALEGVVRRTTGCCLSDVDYGLIHGYVSPRTAKSDLVNEGVPDTVGCLTCNSPTAGLVLLPLQGILLPDNSNWETVARWLQQGGPGVRFSWCLRTPRMSCAIRALPRWAAGDRTLLCCWDSVAVRSYRGLLRYYCSCSAGMLWLL
jgi:hypothetical protein